MVRRQSTIYAYLGVVLRQFLVSYFVLKMTCIFLLKLSFWIDNNYILMTISRAITLYLSLLHIARISVAENIFAILATWIPGFSRGRLFARQLLMVSLPHYFWSTPLLIWAWQKLLLLFRLLIRQWNLLIDTPIDTSTHGTSPRQTENCI